VSPLRGPTCGSTKCGALGNVGNGTVLTIQGQNFGLGKPRDGWGALGVVTIETSGLPEAALTNARTCTPTMRNHTTILCEMPEGQGKDLTVKYTFQPQFAEPPYVAQNDSFIFAYAKPLVTGTSPMHLPMAEGGTITLSGTNLGSGVGVRSGVLWPGLACFADAEQLQLITQTHNKITFKAPAGVAVNVPFLLKVSGQQTAEMKFSYSVEPCVNQINNPITGQCTICKDGEFADLANNVCQPCPPGHRCSGARVEPCVNQVSNQDTGQCVSCKDGEFADSSSNTCRPCPRISADKEAVCTGGKLTLNDGFFSNAAHRNGTRGDKSVDGATVFTKCPCRECCHVLFFNESNSTTAVECVFNTGGTLCGVCQEGFHRQSVNDPCVTCEDAVSTSGFLKRQTPLFVVLGVFLILAGVDRHFGWRWRRWFQKRLQRVWHRIVSKTKVLINFMQLVALLGPVYRFRYPLAFKAFLANFSPLANLDVFRWLPMGCYVQGFNFYDELTVSTLCFLALALAAVAANIAKSRMGTWGKHHRIGHLADSFVSGALVLTYAVSPSLSVKIFSTFNCGTVRHANGDQTRYMRADYSINCDSNAHGTYETFAGLMVLCIAVGTPVGYLLLLKRSVNAEHLLFLSQDYTKECWYWESVEATRKLILTGFAVFFMQGTMLQLVVSLILSVAFLVCVIKMRPYRGTVYANAYAILVNSLVCVVLFVVILIDMDRSLTLVLSNGLAFQLQGFGSDDLGFILIALVSLAIGSWVAFIAFDFDDTRDATLLAKYVPPKDLEPGSKDAQLLLLELEAKLESGEYREVPHAIASTCFSQVRAVLDEAVANGKSDQAQLVAVRRLAGTAHKVSV
jgi:hypothetical protein